MDSFLRAAIYDYEVFVASGMPEDAALAFRRIRRLMQARGYGWDTYILAKHGLLRAINEIRSGRVPGCSIGPSGEIRLHALALVP